MALYFTSGLQSWLDKKPLLIGALGATVLVVFIVGLVYSIFLDPSTGETNNDPASILTKGFPKADNKGNKESSSSTGNYRYAAVAADDARCSTIGTDILARGRGSAVDAAIATMLCVGVANCHSTGIGGGHFMNIYDYPNNGSKTRLFTTILARERAPLNATADMFQHDASLATKGGLAIGVPGEVKGYYEAWKRFGRMSWKELFLPTIEMCQHGYKISRALAEAIDRKENDIRGDANLRALFVNADGSLKKKGEVLVRPRLARTLMTIADDPLAFYNTSHQLAQDVIEDIKEYGGIVSLQDLETYTVYVDEPISVKLNNGHLTANVPRPPSSGVILEYILNILDGFNFTRSDFNCKTKLALAYHRIVEAMKFAFAKRSHLGDAKFVDVQQIIEKLISKNFSSETRHRINDSCTQPPEFYGASFDVLEDGGTSHASVLSPDGSAVSITSTINLSFGAKVLGSRTGILFNDEMDDFSSPGFVNSFGVPASEANYIEPGKMMMSSMSPLIVTDEQGEVVYTSGASGGTKIISATALVFINSMWFGLGLDEATRLSRLHHQLAPTELAIEEDFDQEIQSKLAGRCHKFRPMPGKAVVQTIKKNQHVGHIGHQAVWATSDYRKGGTPDGF